MITHVIIIKGKLFTFILHVMLDFWESGSVIPGVLFGKTGTDISPLIYW